jgi:hypothetical protein
LTLRLAGVSGRFLAWESAGAVFETNTKDGHITLLPMIAPDACGLSLHIEW